MLFNKDSSSNNAEELYHLASILFVHLTVFLGNYCFFNQLLLLYLLTGALQ